MYEAKYLTPHQAEIIRKITNKAKELEPNAFFFVISSECIEYKGQKPEKVVEAIDGIDDDFLIEIYNRETKEKKGGFYLVPDVDDTIFNDCTANEFCEEITKSLNGDY